MTTKVKRSDFPPMKIKEGKKLWVIAIDGDYEMIDCEDWKTEQQHRYYTRVIWRNTDTGELISVDMEEVETHQNGRTGGLKTALSEMAKNGRPCKGRWDRSDYKDAIRNKLNEMRAKGEQGIFPDTEVCSVNEGGAV